MVHHFDWPVDARRARSDGRRKPTFIAPGSRARRASAAFLLKVRMDRFPSPAPSLFLVHRPGRYATVRSEESDAQGLADGHVPKPKCAPCKRDRGGYECESDHHR